MSNTHPALWAGTFVSCPGSQASPEEEANHTNWTRRAELLQLTAPERYLHKIGQELCAFSKTPWVTAVIPQELLGEEGPCPPWGSAHTPYSPHISQAWGTWELWGYHRTRSSCADVQEQLCTIFQPGKTRRQTSLSFLSLPEQTAEKQIYYTDTG